ncbi:MAG: S-layer homology domain-containing protein [Tissierellales bacterium]|nr:S-layer homology domain-containing protein [Tissierellales bacterium]
MKKTLTIIILILIMTTGTLAYAGDFNDIKDTKYEEAVEFLSAFDVINGFGDGTFRPEESVTRGQMAKMLTVVLGYKDFSQNLQSSFADTQGHWADPYVEIVNSFDIVVGYDEDTFGPDNNISYDLQFLLSSKTEIKKFSHIV